MPENPYAAPRSRVDDPQPPMVFDGDLIPEGRGVPAGKGWRWIADAWAFTGQQRGTFIGVFLLYIVVLIVLGIVPFIGFLTSTLLTPVINGGLQLGFDTVRRGGQLEVGCLFSAFRNHAGKLIGVGAITLGITILIGIIVFAILGVSFAGILASGQQPTPEDIQGMLLPGALAVLVGIAVALPLYMFLWFAPPLIVLGGLDVGAALKASFLGCLKNIVPFLVWSFAVLGLWLAVLIPSGLIWLSLGIGAAIATYFLLAIAFAVLLGPVLVASVYLSYRDIFHDV